MQQVVAVGTANKLGEGEVRYTKKEFATIFEGYYKRVYNYIYYQLHCHYTAEDLTSQVFEKVMLKITTYSQNKSPFEIWLFTIARNTVTDYFRTSKMNKLLAMDSLKELVSRRKTPEDLVEMRETKDALLEALNTLDPKARSIIAFKFGACLRNKEIAELLQLSESNVGVILYRSLKKLKDKLLKED